MRRKTLAQYKEEAPEIPTNTCPYIDFIQEIIKIQNQNKFYILEDGKFSDIGNTFKKQLTQGIFKINNWANSVTAHGIAGESIINTYENINADNINKGIIFVAEMSNKGNLITENYTNSIIDMCKHNKFITGFVTQKKISDDSYLYFTPGVSIQSNQDNMDQQYRTPKNAIVDNNCDIIIVGRGIYSHNNCIEKAIEYKLCSYPHFIKKYE